jgi:hypothetical protein
VYQSKRQISVRFGPISEDHGDSRVYENVIPSSIRLLNRLNRDKADIIKTEYSHTLDGMRSGERRPDMEGYLFEALQDAINDELESPVYFGVGPDNKIGVWKP